MTLLNQYRSLAGYNAWMNERLYTIASGLSDEERRRDLGAFFGSVQRTLGHILLADRIWLARFTGDTQRFTSRDKAGAAIAIKGLDQELYPNFDDLWVERQTTDRDLREYIEGCTETRLLEK